MAFAQVPIVYNSAPDSAAITTVTSEVLAANDKRRGAILINDGATKVYLGIGFAAVAGKGIAIAAGGSYEINRVNLTLQAVNVITSSGTSTITFQEAES